LLLPLFKDQEAVKCFSSLHDKYVVTNYGLYPNGRENTVDVLTVFGNDPDLVQAFLKKWWVESDFKAPNFPLSLRIKVAGCHYNSMYNNT
jgi:hypothetical protein